MSAVLLLMMTCAGANDCPSGYYSSYSYSPYTYSYGTTYGSYGGAYGSPYSSGYGGYSSGYGDQSPQAYSGGWSGYSSPMYHDPGTAAYRPPQPYGGQFGGNYPMPPQAGFGTGRPPAQRGNVVMMTDQMRFEPTQITINVGETVRWRNRSRMPHTVTADPNLAANPAHVVLPQGVQPIHSGEIAAGGEFSHTFQTPGIYYYVCLPHEEQGMIGIVVVRSDDRNRGNPQQGMPQQGGGY